MNTVVRNRPLDADLAGNLVTVDQNVRELTGMFTKSPAAARPTRRRRVFRWCVDCAFNLLNSGVGGASRCGTAVNCAKENIGQVINLIARLIEKRMG